LGVTYHAGRPGTPSSQLLRGEYHSVHIEEKTNVCIYKHRGEGEKGEDMMKMDTCVCVCFFFFSPAHVCAYLYNSKHTILSNPPTATLLYAPPTLKTHPPTASLRPTDRPTDLYRGNLYARAQPIVVGDTHYLPLVCIMRFFAPLEEGVGITRRRRKRRMNCEADKDGQGGEGSGVEGRLREKKKQENTRPHTSLSTSNVVVKTGINCM